MMHNSLDVLRAYDKHSYYSLFIPVSHSCFESFWLYISHVILSLLSRKNPTTDHSFKLMLRASLKIRLIYLCNIINYAIFYLAYI